MAEMLAGLTAAEHRPQARVLKRLEQALGREVRDYADGRLAKMLLWCKARVPYYRHRLSRVDDRSIRRDPARVLRELPVLDKGELHRQFDALTATGRSGFRVRRNATGGSTGETAQMLQDAAYRRWNRAVLAHFESWAGWKPGQSRVVLWGIPRDVDRAAGPVHRFRDRLLRRTTLNAYNMSARTMADYAGRLRRRPPALFRVFTQSGIEFARYLHEHGESLDVGAVTSAGALLRRGDRALMEQAFGAPVRDSYGSREVGPIAAEKTPAGGMLVSPATHRLEILREDGEPAEPGEEGEIVITLLVNRVMPLVRYRIGDRGAWADDTPPAGTPAWPRLGRLVGRTMEHLVAADGTLRNSQLMSELVMFVDWVRRFQWVQHARDRLELKVEPHAGRPSDDERERLEVELSREIRRIIGPDCRLEITLSDRIAPSPSGKYHYVICHVD